MKELDYSVSLEVRFETFGNVPTIEKTITRIQRYLEVELHRPIEVNHIQIRQDILTYLHPT
jgi:hypothetical protein